MSEIYDRLKKIKYQLVKNLGYSLTDEDKVSAVRSIYDAAINLSNDIPVDAILPVSSLDTTIEWAIDKKSFVLKLNDVIIEDNLIDNYIPDIDLFKDYLFVNDEEFLINGENLSIVTGSGGRI